MRVHRAKKHGGKQAWWPEPEVERSHPWLQAQSTEQTKSKQRLRAHKAYHFYELLSPWPRLLNLLLNSSNHQGTSIEMPKAKRDLSHLSQCNCALKHWHNRLWWVELSYSNKGVTRKLDHKSTVGYECCLMELFIAPLIYFLTLPILHLEIIEEACLVILKYKWNLNLSLRKGFLSISPLLRIVKNWGSI